MKRATAFVLIGAIIVALIVAMSVYTIDQRKAAVKFQLGEVVAVQTDPGLYFLMPLFQNVRLFDTRIQTLEARDPERFLPWAHEGLADPRHRGGALSPRGDWRAPSDATAAAWLRELERNGPPAG